MTPRRAAAVTALVMFAVYVATLAPSVTFWDSGEFIAAAHSFGIPHPPGTPIFVAALKAWATLLAFISFARATNLFSAVCTAGAVGLTVAWLARTRDSVSLAACVAAGIVAGAMSSVWQNATETEVYAASLLLAVATIAAADVAGRREDRRWLLLVVYFVALAVPLHMSALVASPVAGYLVGQRGDRGFDWPRAGIIIGAAIAAAGVGRVSVGVVLVGVIVVVGAAAREIGSSRDRLVSVVSVLAISLLAYSALLMLPMRAAFDPLVNQGNPRTLEQLAYVVARRQYAVQGLWPRQAPIWIQLANWFEYADWQFALSLGPSVIPTVARVVATLVFATLGVVGALWHWALDRRSWRAVALLLACGSVGVIAYLNLKAGRSFAWPFIPDDAMHEARDRDYFFVLGFWAWGIWAGMGALRTVRVLRLPDAAGVAIALLPVALNWSAVSRRVEPEASLPRELARELLEPLPPRAVLFVSGDNDTYPLWYLQAVEHMRRDVTVVTLPLLGAQWYADELRRRWSLGAGRAGTPERISAEIATSARAMGRPVAVALTVSSIERSRLSSAWKVIGLVATDNQSESTANTLRTRDSAVILVDSGAVSNQAARIERWSGGRVARAQTDPVSEYFGRVLGCPRLMLERRTPAASASLDSLCNLR